VPTTPEPGNDPGELVGVGLTPTNQVVVVSRDPPRLTVLENGRPVSTVALTGVPDTNPGNSLFHAAAPAGLACASCHPEGGDDGHIWNVAGKVRRSQPLQGGVSQTAPFHWQGEHRTLDSLMRDTFVSRMSGAPPDASLVATLSDWLDRALPEPRALPTAPADVLAEGRRAFEASGCVACHSGDRLTNDATVDVGTGGAFQVPSLKAVALRTPLMHDGCAKTVRARFTDPACGGTQHGDVSRLSGPELDALVAYLESL
jgi:mono/diheme cytochrome c family protein